MQSAQVVTLRSGATGSAPPVDANAHRGFDWYRYVGLPVPPGSRAIGKLTRYRFFAAMRCRSAGQASTTGPARTTAAGWVQLTAMHCRPIVRREILNASFLDGNLPVLPWAEALRSLTANLRTRAASTCLAAGTDRRALAVESRRASAAGRAMVVIRAEAAATGAVDITTEVAGSSARFMNKRWQKTELYY